MEVENIVPGMENMEIDDPQQPSGSHMQPSGSHMQPPGELDMQPSCSHMQSPGELDMQPSGSYVQPPDSYMQHFDFYMQPSCSHMEPSGELDECIELSSDCEPDETEMPTEHSHDENEPDETEMPTEHSRVESNEKLEFIYDVKEKKKVIDNFFKYSESMFMTDFHDVAIINAKIKKQNGMTPENEIHKMILGPATIEGQLSKEKEEKVLDLLCESIMHAADCEIENCTVADCAERQHFLLAINLCDTEGWCDNAMCQQFTVLRRHHVKDCKRNFCSFPTCTLASVDDDVGGKKEDVYPVDLFLFQRKLLANYDALKFCLKCNGWKCTKPPNKFSCNCRPIRKLKKAGKKRKCPHEEC